MNTPQPQPPGPSERSPEAEMQILAWLKLKREMSELHARLEYLRLMLSLGVKP